jgi:hypothetical protein
MSIALTDFPLKGKARNTRTVEERPTFLRMNLDLPKLYDHHERRREICRLLRLEFGGRQPKVLTWVCEPVRYPHKRKRDSLLGDECESTCAQCDIERRTQAGRPIMRYVCKIERNHLWETVSAPKPHRSPRQAKKWAKLGVVSTRPKREARTYVLTVQQFNTLREIWVSLHKMNPQYPY